jgi:FMN phosphatase YigB (HAD superfamily)
LTDRLKKRLLKLARTAQTGREFGFLKPAREAFLAALDGMRLSPSRILFLDDGLRNVEAALNVGRRAHVARGPEEARRVLKQHGIVAQAPSPNPPVGRTFAIGRAGRSPAR